MGSLTITNKRSQAALVLLVFVIALFAGVILQRAWLGDDAFITFRTVDNALNGYKFTWNTDEKVQVYTHPLWMLMLTVFTFFFRNIYLVSIILSLFISLAAAGLLLFKLARSRLAGAAAILILALSNAYVDYSTSGLENSLTHLLLVVFFWIYFCMPAGIKRLFFLSLVSSLGILNRMDTLLLFLPPLVAAFFELERKAYFKGFLWVAAGQVPFLLWEIFATVYYGFPFPNTAYAKLSGVIPASELMKHGLGYFLDSIQRDPLTLIIILAACLIVLFRKKAALYPLVISIALYFAYLLKIGGDFMSGRFFAAPLLIAVIILSQLDFPQIKTRYLVSGAVIIIILALMAPVPTFLVDTARGGSTIQPSGISDERRAYTNQTRLLRDGKFNTMVIHPWAKEGELARLQDPDQVLTFNTIGMFGYYAGPQMHIVDTYSIADALLARLPPRHTGRDWRPGHFVRVLPEGYLQMLENGNDINRLVDKDLAKFYEKLSVITRSSTFSMGRLAEIWKMNTGAYDYLIDYDRYHYPEAVKVVCSPPGCDDTSQPVQFGRRGLLVEFNQAVHPYAIEIDLAGTGEFNVELSRNNKSLVWGAARVTPQDEGRLVFGDIPASIRKKGIDQLFLYPYDKNTTYSLLKIAVQEKGTD